MEREQWSKWLAFYEGPVTKAVVHAHTAAKIAGQIQDFLDSKGLTLPTGPVITQEEADKTRSVFTIYNTIGRIMVGVHSGKYGIRIFQGDIDVLAPPDMPKEEYQADQLGAIPLIVWAIVAGGLLVSGLWAGSEMMKANADLEYTKYKNAILKADKAIMKQPPDVRNDWIQRRQNFEAQTEQVKEKTGILVDIFGSKGSAWITAASIALLALFAMRLVPKEK